MVKYADCTIDCTGNACKGDIILFEEGVFGGSYRNPTFLGSRKILAEIISDSYGEAKQQHTFTLRLIRCSGYQAADVRNKAKKSKTGSIRRKGRNVYRNGTKRAAWADEAQRQASLDEKYRRGADARAERAYRRENEEWM